MASELDRLARALWLEAEQLERGVFRVWGGAEPHVVRWTARGWFCDCTAARMRRGECKHRDRVLLAVGDVATLRALRSLVPRPARLARLKVSAA